MRNVIQRKNILQELANNFKPFYNTNHLINFYSDGSWNINPTQRCTLRRKLSDIVNHFDGNTTSESIDNNLRDIEHLILELK